MFCDTVADSIIMILRDLRPNYAYPEVYPRDIVIKMISSMLVVQFASDDRGSDGTFYNFKDIDDIKQYCDKEAVKIYDEKMNPRELSY